MTARGLVTRFPAMRARRWGAGALLLALPLLGGCLESSDIDDLKDFVRNAGTDMRGQIEPPPDLRPAPGTQFTGSGPLAQPFDPVRLDRGERPEQPAGKKGG